MRMLVLGSSGQVGSVLFSHLKNNGHQVIPYDILNSPEEDLRIGGARLDAAIKAAEFVFFLAFDVGGSAYLAKYQDSFDYINNNTRIMSFTFDALKRHKTPFLFASSQMSSMAFSNYGILKLIGERYATALGGIIVKFWNVYGLEHDPDKTHVITDFINMAARDRRIVMRTAGEELRQFLYADDCAEALEYLAVHNKDIPTSANLHITNFKWTSILEVAKIVADIYPGCSILPGKNIDNVQMGQLNEPDPYILQFWKPKTGLVEGIQLISRAMIK